MSVRAGQMRHKITIESVVETRTGSGAITESWETFKTVRAEVLPVSGREYFSAQTTNAQNTVKFNIRYVPNIDSKMRINYDSRIFDIQNIINYRERNHAMTIMGVEHV